MADERSTPHFRRARRQPVCLRVRYRRDEPGAVLEEAGVTSDLGLGGAFIETEAPLPLGTRIVLLVSAPTAWEPLSLPAQVRWVKNGDDGEPRGFGVRFHSLSGATATALHQLVHAAGYSEGADGG